MDFSGIPLFSVMKAKLNYASERQGVLAQNVANADTPGYRARDVSAPDFKEIARSMGHNPAQKLPMSKTSAMHIASSSAAGQFTIQDRKTTDELNPNSNNVVIEEEMMKVAQNQSEYQKTLNLYRKMMGMFNTAVGRGGAGG